MRLNVARAVLQIPNAESSWDCVTENVEHFIWTDNDVITSWNEMAVESNLPSVEHRVQAQPGGHERVFLTYKENMVEVPLTFSRDDSLIYAHTLAQLVKQDSDIRFCVDSWHSSDRAFIALPPLDWQALEKEFGQKQIAYRFLELPKDLQHFLDQAYSERE